MTRMCEYCGIQLKEGESYECPSCGRRFCAAHRGTKEHNCPGIRSTSGRPGHQGIPGKKGGSFAGRISRFFKR